MCDPTTTLAGCDRPVDAEIRSPASYHLGGSREEGLLPALDRLGFLPTREYPVLWRGLDENGYGLFLCLGRAISLRTLGRLADHSDLAGLIERLAASESP
jgi:hypothetical protein